MDDRESRPADRKKQILLGMILLIGLALAGVAHSVLGGTGGQARANLLEEAVRKPLSRPMPSGDLDVELERIARSVGGTNGIMVRSVDDAISGGFRGATLFPQGSLRRLWLGAALLEAVDVGELALDQKVPLQASPKRTEEVGVLLRRAVGGNDLAAQDELIVGLNGPEAMDGWFVDHGFAELSFGPTNRALSQMPTSGPAAAHVARATPDGLAFAISQLAAGRLLNPKSRDLLFGMFKEASPQSYGLGSGWKMRRLNGEPVAAARPTEASTVALVHSPRGETFVLVVMTKDAVNAVARRERLVAGVLSALAIQHP